MQHATMGFLPVSSPFIGLQDGDLTPIPRSNAHYSTAAANGNKATAAVPPHLLAGHFQLPQDPGTASTQSESCQAVRMHSIEQTGLDHSQLIAAWHSRPLLNAAAAAVLQQCIESLAGITPAAQATLLQLLRSIKGQDNPSHSAQTVTHSQQTANMMKCTSNASVEQVTAQQVTRTLVHPFAVHPVAMHPVTQVTHRIGVDAVETTHPSAAKGPEIVSAAGGPPAIAAADSCQNSGVAIVPLASTAFDAGSGAYQKVKAEPVMNSSHTGSNLAASAQQPKNTAIGQHQQPDDLQPFESADILIDDPETGADTAITAQGTAFATLANSTLLPTPSEIHCVGTNRAAIVGAPGSIMSRQQPLRPIRSVVMHKARALAAAAGALRAGPAGSGLKLAGLINRSSSGGLVDSLMSESARAKNGLLTAGLPRSDSLPELVMLMASSAKGAAADAAPAGDSLIECLRQLSELDSFKLSDLDLPSSIGLPSLSFMLEQHDAQGQAARASPQPQSHPLAPPAGQQASEQPAVQDVYQRMLQQQQPAAAVAASAEPIVNPFCGHRQLPGEAAPINAAVQAGVMAAPANLPPPGLVSRANLCVPSFTAHTAAALFGATAGPQDGPPQPGTPALLDDVYTSAFEKMEPDELKPPKLLDPAQALLPTEQRQQPQQHGMPLWQQQQQQQFAGLGGLGVPAARQGLMVQQHNTLQGLLQQAEQELLAEAGARQYAALQFGIMNISATTAGTGQADMDVGELMPNAGHHWTPVIAPTAGIGDGGYFGSGLAAWAGDAAAMGPSGYAAADGQCMQPVGMADQQCVGQGAVPGEQQEVVRYTRVITCKTYLKRLNITQPMAEHLLPPHDLTAAAPRTAGGGAYADEDSPRGNSKAASTYELLFKQEVTLIDEQGSIFRVQYEGVSCNQQKHLRLTSGWRDYIRCHGVEVGDTIVFERRGEERQVLYTTVLKGDGPNAGSDVSGFDGNTGTSKGPAHKRRRLSRSKAVQRID